MTPPNDGLEPSFTFISKGSMSWLLETTWVPSSMLHLSGPREVNAVFFVLFCRRIGDSPCMPSLKRVSFCRLPLRPEVMPQHRASKQHHQKQPRKQLCGGRRSGAPYKPSEFASLCYIILTICTLNELQSSNVCKGQGCFMTVKKLVLFTHVPLLQWGLLYIAS